MFLISRVMENHPIFHPLNPSTSFSTPLIFLIEPRRTSKPHFRITERKDRGEDVVVGNRGWARVRDSY